MKFYSIKSIILVSALILFGGCIGDLDVMPLDPNVMTAEDAYSTPRKLHTGIEKDLFGMGPLRTKRRRFFGFE